MAGCVATTGGADAAGGPDGLAPVSALKLYPHDAQKRLPVVFTCPHCGQVTATAPAGGAPDGEACAATAAGAAIGGAATGIGMGAGTGAGAATAGTPCGGVAAEKGFAAAARGSSAPQPRQNL